VPVIIRDGEQSEQEKLELAIIENLQREDLNAVDRALAFEQLANSFGLSHVQVAQKMGRSREYVSNSIRLLGLPSHMLDALRLGRLSEGHARTLLMLNDRKEEQEVVFQEILLKKLSVREVERIARKIATDKIRKKNPEDFDVHLIEIEKQFTETLGTRVVIQKTDFGGKLTIDYFSTDDLEVLLERIKREYQAAQLAATPATPASAALISEATPLEISPSIDTVETPSLVLDNHHVVPQPVFAASVIPEAVFIPEVSDDIAEDTLIEPEEDEGDLYSINNFTV
jgi:ParB-like chromosome segregation protein Spo0J